jgi:hypothetical protein
MRAVRWTASIAAVGALAAALAATTGAAPSGTSACNLRGSWVAGTAEANRYMGALNPTASEITVARGSLTATFDRGTYTFGGLSLILVGKLGHTKIKEEVDIEATAPYTVRGTRIALGKGSYKLHYVHVQLIIPGGSKTIHLADQALDTPPSSVAYRCTPRTLRLTVPTTAGSGVALNLQRAH